MKNSKSGSLAVAALGIVIGSDDGSDAGTDDVQDEHNQGDVLRHKRVGVSAALVGLGRIFRVLRGGGLLGELAVSLVSGGILSLVNRYITVVSRFGLVTA